MSTDQRAHPKHSYALLPKYRVFYLQLSKLDLVWFHRRGKHAHRLQFVDGRPLWEWFMLHSKTVGLFLVDLYGRHVRDLVRKRLTHALVRLRQ